MVDYISLDTSMIDYMMPPMHATVAQSSVFNAIADPTRRRILDLLIAGERAVMDIVRAFSISQPSISEHLRILREAKLVNVVRQGKQRVYSLNAQPLRELAQWVAAFERFGEDRMEGLGHYLDRRFAAPQKDRAIPQEVISVQLTEAMTMEID